MNSLIAASFERFGAALLGLANSFWIAAAAAALVWVTLRFLWRGNAATRHAAWWAVLAVVVMMPLAPLLVPAHAPAAVAPPASESAAMPLFIYEAAPVALEPAIAAPVEVPGGGWIAWALGVWAAVFLYRMARIGHSYLYLRGMKRQAQAASAEVQARFDMWRTGRAARLLVSRRVASPMAVGFLRPAVILPEALLGELSEAELDHVLLHELAHLARWDDWTNLAARLTGAALGLHPVAAWSLAQLAREREQACDDWVVSFTGGQARPYAASLTRLFELASSRRGDVLASGMAGRGSHLGDRIERLLARGRSFVPHVSMEAVAIGAVVLVALVFFGAQSPQWIAFAQERVAPDAPGAPVPPVAPVAPVAPVPPVAPVAPVPSRVTILDSLSDDLERELSERLRELQQRMQEIAQNQPRREAEIRAAQNQIRAQEAQIRAAQERMQELAQNQPQPEAEIRAMQEQIRAREARTRAELAALQAELRNGKLLIDESGKPFLTELAEAGFKDLPVDTIIKLAQGGVTGSYMREMKEAGFGDLKIEEIIEAAQGGVSARDLKAAREYNPRLTLKQIIELKQGGAL